MEPIENREIRGITVKTAFIIISCTLSIMLTVYGSYSSLRSEIVELRFSKDSDAKLNDLKMRQMDQRIDMINIQLKDLNKRIDDEHLKK